MTPCERAVGSPGRRVPHAGYAPCEGHGAIGAAAAPREEEPRMSLVRTACRAGGVARAATVGAALALALACGGAEESEAPEPEADRPATEAPAEEPAAEPSSGGPAAEEARAGGGDGLSDAAMAEAEKIFSTRCATCHGPKGRGDGPASKGLDPQPRNFHRADWQDSVTDEHIEKIIMYGGAAVGKSAAMPANPDLTGRPEVVDALRAHIRGLGEG